ncbi:MAG TPA: hypothetical protein PLC89_17925 [Haliscomenobacter sp.]|uniref:Cbb3-type cytochrome oxidase component n=1 Tax=Haliscomenobacter hydrossis (strain ATCC 27775 / DSM 1100 / LMG 10767 / O) TaxID=760192 RepID=F4KRD3_HALH1|nr:MULTISPECIES: hypothetical protein [Haliscomenobacter]AEE47923.1 hypothetical protein Halhy_0009 [Haliscomenobacter hydrossis DSM 1100]HOY19191.1 hypothetical protein [Haliscomenobacter sp.]
MYKYILEGVGDINWMAISALLTFVAVFTVSAVMAFRSPLAYLNKMSNLPLDDSILQTSETDIRHEEK